MEAKYVVKHFGNIRQTALKVGCTRNTVYLWLKKGEVGKRWNKKVLLAMMEAEGIRTPDDTKGIDSTRAE